MNEITAVTQNFHVVRFGTSVVVDGNVRRRRRQAFQARPGRFLEGGDGFSYRRASPVLACSNRFSISSKAFRTDSPFCTHFGVKKRPTLVQFPA